MLAIGDGLLRKASWKFTARIAGLRCIRAQGGTEVFQDDRGFLGQCGKLAAAIREANLLLSDLLDVSRMAETYGSKLAHAAE